MHQCKEQLIVFVDTNMVNMERLLNQSVIKHAQGILHKYVVGHGEIKYIQQVDNAHMTINYITGGSCNSQGSSMIPIQKPIREQYFW